MSQLAVDEMTVKDEVESGQEVDKMGHQDDGQSEQMVRSTLVNLEQLAGRLSSTSTEPR